MNVRDHEEQMENRYFFFVRFVFFLYVLVFFFDLKMYHTLPTEQQSKPVYST